MKKLILCTLAGLMILGTAGCTGPFKLTQKVHAWHRGQDGKWIDELAFLGCVILPVYFVATLGDAIIFNSIEFWGGDNPIAAVTSGDETIKMTSNADGSILIESATSTCVLKKTENGVSAYSADGQLLYLSKTGADNKVRVYNAEGQVIRTFDRS